MRFSVTTVLKGFLERDTHCRFESGQICWNTHT